MTRFATLVAQKEIRDQKRYTQKELAGLMQVTESTLSRWMRGHEIKKLDIAQLERMCRVLGCNVGDLLYFDFTDSEKATA